MIVWVVFCDCHSIAWPFHYKWIDFQLTIDDFCLGETGIGVFNDITAPLFELSDGTYLITFDITGPSGTLTGQFTTITITNGNGNFSIISTNLEKYKVQLFSIRGQLVLEKTGTGVLEINTIAKAGIYVLNIIREGKLLGTVKIIVKWKF